ncbi:MAG: hypothetical protein B7Y15_06515 [Bacteroidetes bacterium 24-39-8]|jgi:hypothetical protein|nr:MAG: hypothetical protein B7Y15_06515 [Bacteroidetes bacterium 24-39-8]HQS54484.1 hypothetical protein [Sediminibacterium sp.]
MKSVVLFLFLICTNIVHAHQPDLSNLMIYEQNGKYILVIKSALSAFEGEVDYLFGKSAYKSPEEFQLLVIKHFQKNCAVMMNDENIKLINPKVILGHETTLFAELSLVPKKISSIYIKNTLFKDMPVSLCEMILTLNALPQKQYLLNNVNNYEVKLQLENNSWTVVEDASPNTTLILLAVVAFMLSASVVAVFVIKKRKQVPELNYNT